MSKGGGASPSRMGGHRDSGLLGSSDKLAAGWGQDRFFGGGSSRSQGFRAKAKMGFLSRMGKIQDMLSEEYLTERARTKELKASVAEGIKLCAASHAVIAEK